MASSKSRALTRDIILSAALELVDDAGLSALSLRSLGKRLGVSQAGRPCRIGRPCRTGLPCHIVSCHIGHPCHVSPCQARSKP